METTKKVYPLAAAEKPKKTSYLYGGKRIVRSVGKKMATLFPELDKPSLKFFLAIPLYLERPTCMLKFIPNKIDRDLYMQNAPDAIQLMLNASKTRITVIGQMPTCINILTMDVDVPDYFLSYRDELFALHKNQVRIVMEMDATCSLNTEVLDLLDLQRMENTVAVEEKVREFCIKIIES